MGTYIILSRIADHYALRGLDAPLPADVQQRPGGRLVGPEIAAQRWQEWRVREMVVMEMI